ncbi:MAG TPA: hypothetical protein PLR74_13480, partial [Agriterribacter sp.]|nr:hypothetical protein [Agriterribacter sp.]
MEEPMPGIAIKHRPSPPPGRGKEGEGLRALFTYLSNHFKCVTMAARTDRFTSPDYLQLDELLTEEQKMIRESVRAYVKKE